MADPIVLALEIADEGTYKGQVQIIGGPANTANPPKVDVTIPPITITSVEVTGGALNAATPVIVQTNGSDAAVAPSSTQPVGGALNTANPPKVTVASAEIVGGALNTATPPSVNISNSPTVVVASTQPVGGALNTATPPSVNVANTPAVTISGTPNVSVTNTPAVTLSGTSNVVQPIGAGGLASNTTNPPYQIPVNSASPASQVAAAPSYVPVSIAGAGNTNAANPPAYVPVSAGGGASQVASAPAFVPIAAAGAGNTNTANPPVFSVGRPTQGTGRTYVTAQIASQTTGQTIYTVTGGKKLYVTTIIVSAKNTSTTNDSNIKILDNATELVPILVPLAGAGAIPAMNQLTAACLTFLEPLQFSTNFKVIPASGTIVYSISFVGYEQ